MLTDRLSSRAKNQATVFMSLSFVSSIRAAPLVFGSREQIVDEWRQHGKNRQRPEQAVSAVQNKLGVSCSCGDKNREEHSSRTRIRRGSWIGNHEECEEQERAALKLFHGDRPGIAEPECPAEQDGRVGSDENAADIAAHGAMHHHAAETRHEKAEVKFAAPLSR